jgi:DNA-binding NarL/FixJ family response regulator
VLFGMDDDPCTFWQAACLGINGYLLKDASANEIIGAVRAVAHGEAVCPPHLCMALIQRLAQRSRTDLPESAGFPTKPSLTHRQMQLVDLVAKGMTNKEIAANLNLSEFTVKNHIHRIMKQVDADSRHQVVEMVRAQ